MGMLQVNFASKAREVSIFCPYWIVNKTNLTIRLSDNSPRAAVPATIPPGLGGSAKPLLFG